MNVTIQQKINQRLEAAQSVHHEDPSWVLGTEKDALLTKLGASSGQACRRMA